MVEPLLPTIHQFLDALTAEKKYSAYTVRNYARALELFQAFCHEKGVGRLSAIDRNHCRTFLHAQQERVGRKTLHNYASAIRSFLKYLQRKSLIDKNPWVDIQLPKQEKSLPLFLTQKQMIDLLNGPLRLLENETLDAFEAHRDALLLELLYGGGFRVSELVALQYGDIDKTQGVAKVLGKGKKERLCPIGGRALTQLKRFQQEFAVNQHVILTDDQGHPMNARAVQLLLKKYLRLADLPSTITPHKIRHSYATHLLEGGADLRVLQELLGHVSLSTTQIYTHVNLQQLKEVHSQCHPRA